MKALQDKAVFYIPTDLDRYDTRGAALADQVAEAASKKFGGATVTPGVGYWKGDREGVTLVTVFSDRDNDGRTKFASFVEATAKGIGAALNQEAVMVEVNGSAGLYTKGEDYY